MPQNETKSNIFKFWLFFIDLVYKLRGYSWNTGLKKFQDERTNYAVHFFDEKVAVFCIKNRRTPYQTKTRRICFFCNFRDFFETSRRKLKMFRNDLYYSQVGSLKRYQFDTFMNCLRNFGKHFVN